MCQISDRGVPNGTLAFSFAAVFDLSLQIKGFHPDGSGGAERRREFIRPLSIWEVAEQQKAANGGDSAGLRPHQIKLES
jgi:hypothetical protein